MAECNSYTEIYVDSMPVTYLLPIFAFSVFIGITYIIRNIVGNIGRTKKKGDMYSTLAFNAVHMLQKEMKPKKMMNIYKVAYSNGDQRLIKADCEQNAVALATLHEDYFNSLKYVFGFVQSRDPLYGYKGPKPDLDLFLNTLFYEIDESVEDDNGVKRYRRICEYPVTDYDYYVVSRHDFKVPSEDIITTEMMVLLYGL